MSPPCRGPSARRGYVRPRPHRSARACVLSHNAGSDTYDTGMIRCAGPCQGSRARLGPRRGGAGNRLRRRASAATDKRTTDIQVIARAGEILRQLAKSRSRDSTRVLAEATGLPRSTVHRIVVALAGEHLVVWDPEQRRSRARAGPRLSRARAAGSGCATPCAHTSRRWCAASTRPSTSLCSAGTTAVVVDQVQAHQHARRLYARRHAAGARHSLRQGAARGLTLDDLDLLPEKLKAFTPNTITDRATLLEELATSVRRAAFDHDEHNVGVSGVAG